jgi:hypothetical protein
MKTGRPPLQEDQIRNIRYTVFFSTSEDEIVNEKASIYNITVSQFLRISALNRTVKNPKVTNINLNLYRTLCGLANNFNQIARSANIGQTIVDNAELQLTQNLIHKLINMLINNVEQENDH